VSPPAGEPRRAGLGLAGLAVALLVFFSLPWLTLSCAGQPIGRQNGFQVVYGGVTSLEKKDGKKDASGGAESEEGVRKPESVAAWWLAVVPLGALAAGYAGLRIARGRRHERLALAGSGVAALVLTLNLVAGLPFEREIARAQEEAKSNRKRGDDGVGDMLASVIQARRTRAPWGACLTTWAMLGLAIHLSRRSPAELGARVLPAGKPS